MGTMLDTETNPTVTAYSNDVQNTSTAEQTRSGVRQRLQRLTGGEYNASQCQSLRQRVRQLEDEKSDQALQARRQIETLRQKVQQLQQQVQQARQQGARQMVRYLKQNGYL